MIDRVIQIGAAYRAAANRAPLATLGRRILIRPEQIVYRTAGFPVALRCVVAGAEVSEIRSVFAHEYWRETSMPIVAMNDVRNPT